MVCKCGNDQMFLGDLLGYEMLYPRLYYELEFYFACSVERYLLSKFLNEEGKKYLVKKRKLKI